MQNSGKIMYRPHLKPNTVFKYQRSDNEYIVAKDGSLHNVTKRELRAEQGRTKKDRRKYRSELNLAQKTV